MAADDTSTVQNFFVITVHNRINEAPSLYKGGDIQNVAEDCRAAPPLPNGPRRNEAPARASESAQALNIISHQ
jgi:hypothetical protein